MLYDVAINRQHPVLHRLTPMGERLDANRQLFGFVLVVLHIPAVDLVAQSITDFSMASSSWQGVSSQ